jgi:2-polyprenyl-3-methyl-5-hydroxy-6-metoxy-1,4-benzoquinol methylase
MDKAGQKYWDDSWASSDIPKAVNPSDMRLWNHVNRQFHKLFLRLFDKSETASMRLLEIGCAKSAWLPYFVKEFGFKVGGIDYSPIGCQMARQVLQANGVEAEVVCADFFEPPENLLGTFDVVVSFGVIEHFDDTAACLRAVSSFLKPGGLLITNIPNMVGSVGAIQKLVNKPVYDIHQLIDPAKLKEAHELAGLEVLQSDYFLFTSFGINNLVGVPTGTVSWYLKKIFLGLLARASVLVWSIEAKIGDFSPRKFIAPYVNCIARKP